MSRCEKPPASLHSLPQNPPAWWTRDLIFRERKTVIIHAHFWSLITKESAQMLIFSPKFFTDSCCVELQLRDCVVLRFFRWASLSGESIYLSFNIYLKYTTFVKMCSFILKPITSVWCECAHQSRWLQHLVYENIQLDSMKRWNILRVLFHSRHNQTHQPRFHHFPLQTSLIPQQTQQSHNSAVYRGHWQLSYPSMHHTLCPTLWGTERDSSSSVKRHFTEDRLVSVRSQCGDKVTLNLK